MRTLFISVGSLASSGSVPGLSLGLTVWSGAVRWLAGAVILVCACFSVLIGSACQCRGAGSDGSLEIAETQVPEGAILEIRLQSPPDRQFITQIRIFKDPSAADIASNYWPLVNLDGMINIGPEQDAVSTGTPFTVYADLLNYGTGRWFFIIFAPGKDSVFDSVEILAAPPITFEATNSGLYSATGALLGVFGDTNRVPTVGTQAVCCLAFNLTEFTQAVNQVTIDFRDWTDRTLLRSSLMRVKMVRASALGAVLSGAAIAATNYPDGIIRVWFRTPAHQKYYEADGILHFRFSGVTTNGISREWALKARWDDAPAAPAIPTFAEFNATTYPGQVWRDGFPKDSAHVRLVRLGNVGLVSTSALRTAEQDLMSYFGQATKGYFRLDTAESALFPLVQPRNFTKVTNWYANVPKTPGKPILDLADSNALFCATLLYYYEHDENEFVTDMQQIYPARSGGEDITLYLFDGPGSLAQAMGAPAARIKVTRLYPAGVFYTGTGTNKTYHFDATPYPWLGGTTVVSYLNWHWTQVAYTQIVNSTIHELGHIYWLERAGLTASDQTTRKYPFSNDTLYEDDSFGYFTRAEYMSYDRDRNVLAGMTYGDAYLEMLLAAYPDSPDWDADGLPNDWEWQYSGNPTNQTAGIDSDGDGYSNLAEYIGMSNPTNRDSMFRIGASAGGGGMAFDVVGWTNRVYRLEICDDLLNPAWRPVEGYSNRLGSDIPVSYAPTTTEGRVYFYRLAVGLP